MTSAVPRWIYGTAWKEERTAGLVEQALAAGFRAIDTANQRRHYCEAAVGEALGRAYAAGVVARDELFLQTKFTHRGGQDHRLPYDPAAPVAVQVEQSCASSLLHLGTDRIDAYLLHGPSAREPKLDAADWEAWHAMETLVDQGHVGALGISNVGRGQLESLCARARIAPTYVQNRCYAARGWDREVREACRDRGIHYQAFSLLTANARVLAGPELRAIANELGRTPAQVSFRFVIQIGMIPLTGTSDPRHMAEDLETLAFELDDAQVRTIERLT